jgi:hypothetical protein
MTEQRCTVSAVTSRGLRGVTSRPLELARAVASLWDEAHALAGLGQCAMANGHAA